MVLCGTINNLRDGCANVRDDLGANYAANLGQKLARSCFRKHANPRGCVNGNLNWKCLVTPARNVNINVMNRPKPLEYKLQF